MSRIAAERHVQPEQVADRSHQPQTRSELQAWVREHLHLARPPRQNCCRRLTRVFSRHERLWQESKQEAIQALSAGFRGQDGARQERALGQGRDRQQHRAVLRELVADLTDKIAARSEDQADELQPVHRAARVVPRARAARHAGARSASSISPASSGTTMRSATPSATGSSSGWRSCFASRSGPTTSSRRNAPAHASQDLHARFGGDEFCFLIPDLADARQAHAIAERFREAVERYDWTLEDRRLAVQPVRVDVGVVCLRLGRVAERRFVARRLSARSDSARRQADVRGQGRARQPHLPDARRAQERRADRA